MGSGSSKRKKTEVSDKAKSHKTLPGHTGGINCMDISSSGAYLLTGSDDRTVRVWDLVTYENMIVLEGHTGYISCCRVFQDRYALTGSVDRSVRKWNIFSGNCILQMDLHHGMVNRMLVFGSYLFTSSYDRTVICWNVNSGHAARVLRGHKRGVLPLLYVKTMEHDPKGGEDVDRNKDAIITGSMDCTAKIWSINSGTTLRTFIGHKGAILCLTMDKEKKFLFTGSTDCSIKKWSVANGSLLKTFNGHEGSIICLEINHKLLYSGSVDGTARCWVAEFGDTTRRYACHEHMLSDMKYHDGLLITSSGDCTICVFDAKSGTLRRTFKGHKHAVNCILPVDNIILSASYDGSIRIWNIRDLIREKLDCDEESGVSQASSEAPSLLHQRIDDVETNPHEPAVHIGLSDAKSKLQSSRSQTINNADMHSVAQSTFLVEEEGKRKISPATKRRHKRDRGNRNKVTPAKFNSNLNNNEILSSLESEDRGHDRESGGYPSRSITPLSVADANIHTVNSNVSNNSAEENME